MLLLTIHSQTHAEPVRRPRSIAETGFYSDLRNLAIDDQNAPRGALSNLTTSKLGAISSSREFMAKQFGSFTSLVNEGSGRNMGAEAMLKYIGQHGFAWLSYTENISRRVNIEGRLYDDDFESFGLSYSPSD